MKVAILYRAVLKQDMATFQIGGVESYCWELAQLCLGNGYEPAIFQLSDEPSDKTIRNVKVFGVGHWSAWHDVPAVGRILHEASEKWRDGSDGITVFALDHFSVLPTNPRSIVIQHGIEFDVPLPPNQERETGIKRSVRASLESNSAGRRILEKRLESIVTARSAKFRQQFDQVPYRVCVDHNYVNWYRTQAGYVGLDNYWVIPNFCKVVPESEVQTRLDRPVGKRILYARRFVPYRGCLLMKEVIPVILERHPDATFTFAGEGPCETDLNEFAAQDSRVRITRYNPGEEAELLRTHDISVTPSLGSEGTTLAVAEAMGAGCAVVATDVGGITNMILDGFNGLLVQPSVEGVTSGILKLLDDPAMHRKLARNGHAVASQAFTIERWRATWSEVLECVAHGNGVKVS